MVQVAAVRGMSVATRRLVEEASAAVGVDDARVDVAERIAGLEIVQVHVAGHEDRARLVVAAIEGHARVIEQPVGAGRASPDRSTLDAP